MKISGRFGKRAASFVLVAAVLGIPAGALRAMCFRGSCENSAKATTETPFCSLPEEVRDLVANGFHEGRSPDLMAVTGKTLVSGGRAFPGSAPQPLWPSVAAVEAGRVPIVFSGVGVDAGTDVPPGAAVDTLAGTIARIIDLRRPNPDVRSGRALAEIVSGEVPRLVLEVVWSGIGSDELEAGPTDWPVLRRLMSEGAGTLEGRIGSLPLDPAATIATIGTGGLPSQHGMTGTLVRSDGTAGGAAGEVVRAWGADSPVSVIATLGDHLDEVMRQRPVIGLVANDVSGKGLVGGDWYPGGDQDVVKILGRDGSAAAAARVGARVLRSHRFGKDRTPDLLGIVLGGDVSQMDAALGDLVRAAEAASDGSLAVAVTSTGRSDRNAVSRSLSAEELAARIDRKVGIRPSVIDATSPGGLYLDQERLTSLKMSDDSVLKALLSVRTADEDLVMADAFPSIAITFGRYC